MKTKKAKARKKPRKTRKKIRKKNTKTFSKKDYNSKDGMLTSVWGPSFWHTLHVISFNFPVSPSKKDKKDYREFIMSLKNILPCGICRKNLTRNLKTCPLTNTDLKSRDNFSKWMYNLHELINKMLNKTSNLTYNDVKDRYENFRSRCTIDIKLKNKEDGCTSPLYGKKAKCLLRIVPDEKKVKTMKIDRKCIKTRIKQNY